MTPRHCTGTCRTAAGLLVVACAVVAAGCGNAPKDGASRGATVYAASSLAEAFPAIAEGPRYSFAGSDTLRAQIERGAPADVFAAASPKEPETLFHAGRCTRPVTFATNVLVLITPAKNPGRISSVDTLRDGGKRVAVGTADVPIGAYTRKLLTRLGLASVLRRNRVSEEPSVSSIVSKVALGSADAGFVYRTDAQAAATRTRTLALPSKAQPPVRYEVCAVVRPGADTAAAQRFIRGVTSRPGRAKLRSFGFGLPSKG